MEIERKFLIKILPDLKGIEKISYERYYLYRKDGIELRIQRKNSNYELERKVGSSSLSRESNFLQITEGEFENLKTFAKEPIVRDSYQISSSPNTSIKIYHDKFEGLVRVEFEFESEEEAKSFSIPDWVGSEITDTRLGRDSRLLDLTDQEFANDLKRYS